MRIKWRVAPPPEGRFRSFERRGWPSAEYENGSPAAWIGCEDEYNPKEVKAGIYSELTLYLADYSKGGETWERKRAIQKFKTIKEAKEWFKEFIEKHLEVQPKQEK